MVGILKKVYSATLKTLLEISGANIKGSANVFFRKTGLLYDALALTQARCVSDPLLQVSGAGEGQPPAFTTEECALFVSIPFALPMSWRPNT